MISIFYNNERRGTRENRYPNGEKVAKIEITIASFFFHELVDENRYPNGVNGLGGNKKIIVIVDDGSE